jgi:V-type H+-transporting ATPase subunit a
MNKMRINNNLFITYFWSPRENIHHSFSVKELIEVNIDSIQYKKLKPPTHFDTNDFTFIPQVIVNTYGTPAYGEINPAVFTNISFPFLFGVMFGDIGHGTILLIFASIICLGRDRFNNNPDMQLLVQGRYILLMMGIFALYMGLVYNDFMSLPLQLFGKSCFDQKDGMILQKSDNNCMYRFGIDPAWLNTTSDISFFNSFKMKMSVILGVAHMTMGVVLKGTNAIHFNNRLDLLHEVIPQLLLLLCLFGFMDYLILMKWMTDYKGIENQSPSIVNSIINVFLNMGAPNPESNELDVLTHQEFWSKLMLTIAIITPPWMLLVKPLILKRQHQDRKAERRKRGGDYEMSVSPRGRNEEDDE